MLNIGDTIGEWKVLATLGEGGMGAVYLCQHRMSERLRSAVKVLKPHSLGDETQRFVREVEVLFSLRHPSIVRVTGWGEDTERGLLWMAMELVQGSELGVVLQDGPLDEATATRLFRKLADGLAHAHDHGVVHRDIKAANIMVTETGEPRLLDFGIALDTGKDRLTATGVFAGTLAYLPPEAFETSELDPKRGDVYSLGLLMYEALVGSNPFQNAENLSGGQRVAAVMREKLTLVELDPGEDFSDELRDTVRRATAQDPQERMASMRELAVALGAKETSPAAVPRELRPTESMDRPDPVTESVRTGSYVLAAGGIGLAGAVAASALIAVLAAVGFLVSSAPTLATTGPEPLTAAVPVAAPLPEPEPLTEPVLPPVSEIDLAEVPPEPDEPDEPELAPEAPPTTVEPPPAAKPTTKVAKPAAQTAPAQTRAEPKPVAKTWPVTFASVPLGATVWIDGAKVGQTPLSGHPVPSGRHTVRMQLGDASSEMSFDAGRRSATRHIWKGGETWQSGY